MVKYVKMRKSPLKRKTSWKPRRKPKTKPHKRERIEPIKSLKKRVWSLISQYVRQRDKGKCATCGAIAHWKEMDCGHFRHNSERNSSFGGNALWWDLRNLNCQCFSCNRMRHGKLDHYAIFLEAKYGYGIIQELDKLWRTYKLWTREELLTKIAWLEKELEKYIM